MFNPWPVEIWRLGIVLIALFAIWSFTDNWLLATLLPLIIYISWHIYQLYCLERWLKSNLKKEKIPDTNGVWGLIVQHIYSQKQLQRKHKKKFKTLLKKFNSTVSAFPDAAILLNQNKEIEWSNQAAKKLLNIEYNRDKWQYIGDLIQVEKFQQSLSKNNFHLELNYPSESHIVVHLIPLGKKQFLLTASDISQLINIQRMREDFVANASHELRTPLTVIAGYLEILESSIAKELHEPVLSALSQANRMGQIIEDLLVLSRLETTQLSKHNCTIIDMSAILVNMINDIQKTVAMDNQTLSLETDSSLKILAVESEVNSVCLNIIKNAIKHTPAGTTIQIKWFANDTGQACLQVIDDGKGILAKDIPHLTERFYRVNVGRSRQVGGTGLGLAIVKHIMERHKGYLLIDSQPDIATTFTACFPNYEPFMNPL